jgi:hypothetical protein
MSYLLYYNTLNFYTYSLLYEFLTQFTALMPVTMSLCKIQILAGL